MGKVEYKGSKTINKTLAKQIMKRINQGIVLENGETRAYDYADFALRESVDVETFIKGYSTPRKTKEYAIFIEQWKKREDFMISLKTMKNEKFMLRKGEDYYEVTDEDKDYIYYIMQVKNIPMERAYYLNLVRKYVKGEQLEFFETSEVEDGYSIVKDPREEKAKVYQKTL